MIHTSAVSHKLYCKIFIHPEQVPHNLKSFGALVPLYGITNIGTNNARLLRMTKVRHAPEDVQMQYYF